MQCFCLKEKYITCFINTKKTSKYSILCEPIQQKFDFMLK